MWTDYPIRSITGLSKFYYLAQFAFWLQQIVVIHVEEKRKDHYQMLTHHFITSLLMFGSWGCYQTRVGNVILCLMDVVDLFLPVRSGHTNLLCVSMPSAQSLTFGFHRWPRCSSMPATTHCATMHLASLSLAGSPRDTFSTLQSAGRFTRTCHTSLVMRAGMLRMAREYLMVETRSCRTCSTPTVKTTAQFASTRTPA